MSNNTTIYLKDYQYPVYVINRTELSFELETTAANDSSKKESETETVTIVKSRLEILRNHKADCRDETLILNGQGLDLKSVLLNGQPLSELDYQCTDEHLIIPEVPYSFILEIETWIKPEENKALEGLYQSSGNFCTQCEAEGFRRITYYLDQPDVMSTFTTAIVADKEKYPVLLSNGNLVEQGELPEGRHYAVWHDPFKKPCYLFALVAGDLLKIEDFYTTLSGRNVTLQLFVEKQNAHKCEHAMNSLKNAMMWDEEVFALEYDLDIYMIVAVEDFNMGAMENKGLNVFNAKYVLADPQSATDNDYEGIEGVIGHEYFHNWTGNRVTCRDWFQLSLKEGLTVFRDQEFTSDMQSRAVKRIDDVRILRAHQFAEDAGPMAHPIRPAQYMEINNFYTVTVYNKGAEVIRMIHTVLGEENFQKGMDLYFQRHDGQAVTTEDFVSAMSDASQIDLGQFSSWYNQAGTPRVKVKTTYLADEKKLIIELQQFCALTSYETLNSPDKKVKVPFYIPIKMGLLNQQGEQILEDMIILTKEQQQFEYTDIDEKPVLSLLRDFSAPIILEYPDELAKGSIADERAFLMACDPDPFNRWEAGQQLAAQLIIDAIGLQSENAKKKGQVKIAFNASTLDKFIHGCEQILNDAALDNALKAQALVLPSESYLLEQLEVADVDAVYETRKRLKLIMAERLHSQFKASYDELSSTAAYQFNADEAGKRSLRNLALSYLMAKANKKAAKFGYKHFQSANNMTDSMAALAQLAHIQSDYTQQALDSFEQRWSDDALVMDKWFIVQAVSQHDNVLQQVKSLMQHKSFDLKNPNKVRSLIGSFAGMNLKAFHNSNGLGYQFVMEQILALDKFNPQIASRMVKLFSRWRRYDKTRQKLMKAELKRAAKEELSPDVFEIVTKSLK
ncbi:MAG: aminopeptidase N [Gammaproteobacteria bacterium]|nr:aminopeptidase N [Gammaproteobacteria bacterium]